MIKREMITLSDTTLTPAEWDAIREIVLRHLGVDANIIPDFCGSIRSSIEVAVSRYRYKEADIRSNKRRAEKLIALRKRVETTQARIIDAFTVRIAVRLAAEEKESNRAPSTLKRSGVDFGMLTTTRDYFTKALRNIDRQIEQCGSPRGNASKIARDQCWRELLEIWCNLDGKPRGVAAAEFIRTVSLTVMMDVPPLAAVVQWLHRQKTGKAEPVAKVLRRARIASGRTRSRHLDQNLSV